MTPELKVLAAQIVAKIRLMPIPDNRYNDEGGFWNDTREDVARSVARHILTALDVDGLSGCRLCCN